ncbi:uncharacterized protein LOC126623817 [Malus sylvestris]|uniref:uncharacterized protein LOC126623817 n=1 Tax=Malus sylvestris TaxID=3752 RepID=UPI0021AC2552|nr:uncharacterized protein LOC126623817 [Malus sylvestris]
MEQSGTDAFRPTFGALKLCGTAVPRDENGLNFGSTLPPGTGFSIPWNTKIIKFKTKVPLNFFNIYIIQKTNPKILSSSFHLLCLPLPFPVTLLLILSRSSCISRSPCMLLQHIRLSSRSNLVPNSLLLDEYSRNIKLLLQAMGLLTDMYTSVWLYRHISMKVTHQQGTHHQGTHQRGIKKWHNIYYRVTYL